MPPRQLATAAAVPKPRQDDAARSVANLVRRLFGERPRGLEPLTGGLNNHVFRCTAGGRALVVRMHDDPARADTYAKEAWAMRQAQPAGVPTPHVLHLGHEGERPFVVQAEVPGIPGTHWSEPSHVLRQLGQLAARLHQVRLPGFGHGVGTGPAGGGTCASWGAFMAQELRVHERLRMLDRVNALPLPAREALEATLSRMQRWRGPGVLHHGDLRLKNVIVSPDDGRVMAVIDWEDCLSAPPPHWDLAIALHDVGPDEKEAFLEGYGLTPAEFARLAPALRALNVLNYAWAMHHALKDGQRERAAWLKARLRGVFDLAV